MIYRVDLAGGQWKMVALTNTPIPELIDVPSETITQYAGVYTPNEYCRFFRDCLEVPSFDLALRFEVPDPKFYVRVQVFDVTTLGLVAEQCGRKVRGMPSCALVLFVILTLRLHYFSPPSLTFLRICRWLLCTRSWCQRARAQRGS